MCCLQDKVMRDGGKIVGCAASGIVNAEKRHLMELKAWMQRRTFGRKLKRDLARLVVDRVSVVGETNRELDGSCS